MRLSIRVGIDEWFGIRFTPDPHPGAVVAVILHVSNRIELVSTIRDGKGAGSFRPSATHDAHAAQLMRCVLLGSTDKPARIGTRQMNDDMHMLSPDGDADHGGFKMTQHGQDRSSGDAPLRRRQSGGIAFGARDVGCETALVESRRRWMAIVALDVLPMMSRAEPARVAGQPRSVGVKCDVKPLPRLSARPHVRGDHDRRVPRDTMSDNAHRSQSVGFFLEEQDRETMSFNHLYGIGRLRCGPHARGYRCGAVLIETHPTSSHSVCRESG